MLTREKARPTTCHNAAWCLRSAFEASDKTQHSGLTVFRVKFAEITSTVPAILFGERLALHFGEFARDLVSLSITEGAAILDKTFFVSRSPAFSANAFRSDVRTAVLSKSKFNGVGRAKTYFSFTNLEVHPSQNIDRQEVFSGHRS
jgi:hypothetical protein